MVTDFWKNVTHNAAAFHFLFYPLQHAVKQYANIPFDEFVNNAFDYYHQQWKDESLSNLQFLDSTEKNNVVDEKYPYKTADGSIISLQKSYKDLPQFVDKK